jgi:hypothetical protein
MLLVIRTWSAVSHLTRLVALFLFKVIVTLLSDSTVLVALWHWKRKPPWWLFRALAATPTTSGFASLHQPEARAFYAARGAWRGRALPLSCGPWHTMGARACSVLCAPRSSVSHHALSFGKCGKLYIGIFISIKINNKLTLTLT